MKRMTVGNQICHFLKVVGEGFSARVAFDHSSEEREAKKCADNCKKTILGTSRQKLYEVRNTGD